jgi:hypothetical protein
MDWARFDEYGLIGVIVGVLFFIQYRIISYTMTYINKITEQQAKEREAWQAIISSSINTLQLHNQQSIEAHNNLKEAANYQRQEHKEMIESLGRINGYTH